MLNSEEIIAAIHGSYATGSKNGFQNVLTLLDKMHVALRTPIWASTSPLSKMANSSGS